MDAGNIASPSKYVPPHLRHRVANNSSDNGNNYGPPKMNNYASSQDEYRNYDRNGARGGYSRYPADSREPLRSTNNRWSEGGSGGGSSYYRSGGGGGNYQRATKNEMGFHGDLRPDSRLERELFSDAKSSGINFDKYDDIPVETSGENIPEPISEFRVEELGVEVVNNLNRCKYTKPTPVQKYSMPIGLLGRDMMACAQTGSGKTGGFLFPTLAMLIRTGPREAPNDANRRRKKVFPSALILAPTRELASQIHDEARKFCYCTGIAPVVVYGGAEIKRQLADLDRGCDLLVATPGRLVDMIERGIISLSCVSFLILDEADRMLDMGFEPQIRRIVDEEGMPRDRQTFMFSATFPKEIQKLAADFLKDYIFLAVGRVGSASKDVKQTIEFVEQNDKNDYLLRFLNTIQDGLILIFVETKRKADFLEEFLCEEGYPATSIHGDRTQREREDALKSFKSGKTPVLVATDVASRGLDISGVTQVINYDMPGNIDDYVHRIGRTGRVGNIGSALSMMNDKNRNIARELFDMLNENGQEQCQWLYQMVNSGCSYRGGSTRGGRRGGGGGRFGARDYRNERGAPSSGSGFERRGYGGGQSAGGWRNGGDGGGNYDDNSAWY